MEIMNFLSNTVNVAAKGLNQRGGWQFVPRQVLHPFTTKATPKKSMTKGVPPGW